MSGRIPREAVAFVLIGSVPALTAILSTLPPAIVLLLSIMAALPILTGVVIAADGLRRGKSSSAETSEARTAGLRRALDDQRDANGLPATTFRRLGR